MIKNSSLPCMVFFLLLTSMCTSIESVGEAAMSLGSQEAKAQAQSASVAKHVQKIPVLDEYSAALKSPDLDSRDAGKSLDNL